MIQFMYLMGKPAFLHLYQKPQFVPYFCTLTFQIFSGMNACYHNTIVVGDQQGGINMMVVAVKH